MAMIDRGVPRNGRRPKYERGQIIQHARYGYRGVVVDWDLVCLADDRWYGANKTQPARAQPWYHVLVHDTDGTTYAAQDSLRGDRNGGQPVTHPLIDKFFSEFVDGRYIRNDRRWPRWS